MSVMQCCPLVHQNKARDSMLLRETLELIDVCAMSVVWKTVTCIQSMDHTLIFPTDILLSCLFVYYAFSSVNSIFKHVVYFHYDVTLECCQFLHSCLFSPNDGVLNKFTESFPVSIVYWRDNSLIYIRIYIFKHIDYT